MRENVDEFDAYLNHLGQALGHADRHAGLKGYCSGMVMPLSRKSVEPMAAHIAPPFTRVRNTSHSTILWPRQNSLTGRFGIGCANGCKR